MSKLMSMHDAIAAYVQDGDTLSFSGFTTNRKPYAAVHEVLRQGQGNFTLWGGPAGGEQDLLIGEGRVRVFINCYTANSGFSNVLRRYRAAIEQGKILFEDYSMDAVMLQFHAAGLGLPYIPVRLMQGSDLVDKWGISREVRRNEPSLDDDKLVVVENPFVPGEKVVALPVPRIDCAILHVQQASPDGTCVIEGDEFGDVDMAVASKRTVVTCEEVVSDEYIRRDPTRPKIFGACVDAVVHAPYGAWPSQCYGYYDDDVDALREYDAASKYYDQKDAEQILRREAAKKGVEYDPDVQVETFTDYLQKYVYGVKDHAALLDKLGATRLIKLKNVPGLGYAGQIE